MISTAIGSLEDMTHMPKVLEWRANTYACVRHRAWLLAGDTLLTEPAGPQSLRENKSPAKP